MRKHTHKTRIIRGVRGYKVRVSYVRDDHGENIIVSSTQRIDSGVQCGPACLTVLGAKRLLTTLTAMLKGQL